MTATPLAATAGALGVSPVGFELSSAQKAAVLTVRNDGDTPMSVQVRVFRWTQKDGADQLAPTDAVVVSPPLASLDPHTDQVVRLVRLAPSPTDAEESFRVIVDELPSAPPPGSAPVVTLLMRHSIPVFYEPAAPVNAALTWRIESSKDGLMLVAHNAGRRRERIADVTAYDADGHPLGGHKGLLGYVLPGGDASWPCPGAQAGKPDPRRLTASTDLGPLDVRLQPASP